MVAYTRPGRPGVPVLGYALKPAPSAPRATTVICVTPLGTVNVCSLPVYLNVLLPLTAPASLIGLPVAIGTDPPPHAESSAAATLMLNAERLNSKVRTLSPSLPAEDDLTVAACSPAGPPTGSDCAWLDVRRSAAAAT